MTTRIPSRYHRIDGWRGYSIPGTAVLGSSDTGTWSDSPCPTPEVLLELNMFRTRVLKRAGIKSRLRGGESSNVFCRKIWVCVASEDWKRASDLANKYLEDHKYDLRFAHTAMGDTPNVAE